MAHRKTRHTVENLPFSVQKRDGTPLPAETRRIRYNNAASEMSEGFERGVGMHPYSPLSVLARTTNQLVGALGGDYTRNIRHGINIDKAKRHPKKASTTKRKYTRRTK